MKPSEQTLNRGALAFLVFTLGLCAASVATQSYRCNQRCKTLGPEWSYSVQLDTRVCFCTKNETVRLP